MHLDAGAGTLRYSRAGHLPPLLVDQRGTASFLTDGAGPPLGVQAGPRPQTRVGFPELATLVLYTDGLVERRDRGLEAGLHELSDVVTRRAGLDVEVLADVILRELLGDGQAPDDVVLVVARGCEQRQGG